MAVERPLAKNAAIVGNAIARNTNRNRSSRNGERPRRKGRSRARVDEAIVRGQVIGVFGCSMVCPIGWRGAHHAAPSKHESSLESRIRQGAIAQCQVNVLLHEIDDTGRIVTTLLRDSYAI